MSDPYDTAIVCRDGHLINPSRKARPDDSAKFCTKCGAIGIDHCEHCNEEIRGSGMYYNSAVKAYYPSPPDLTKPPKYCRSCGKPFPWTSSRIEAAKELIAEMGGLKAEDKKLLTATLPDLVKDSPRTEVASARYQKVVKKLAVSAKNGLKGILWEIVTESVRKSIFRS